MTRSAVNIRWAAEVADHDYAAAEAYLSLKLSEDAVARAVQRLRRGFHRVSLVYRLDPFGEVPLKLG